MTETEKIQGWRYIETPHPGKSWVNYKHQVELRVTKLGATAYSLALMPCASYGPRKEKTPQDIHVEVIRGTLESVPERVKYIMRNVREFIEETLEAEGEEMMV